MPDADQPQRDDQPHAAAPATRGSAAGPIPLEEVRLVQRARAGDRDALGTLLKQQEGRLFSICLRMVSDREEARDLTQEALVKAIHALDSFDERARFGTWITRIAINACVSHLRKRKLRGHPSLDGAVSSSEAGQAGLRLSDRLEQQREPAPASGVERDERLETLRLAMQALPADQRALLLMRDGQDMDYASIASALGVRLGTVKSRLFRARAALRDAMEQLQADRQPTTKDESAPPAGSNPRSRSA